MRPLMGFKAPDMVFRRVDFPAPLAPRRTTISALWTRISTSWIAKIFPYPEETPSMDSTSVTPLFAQVSLDNLRVILDLGGITFGNLLPEIQDRNNLRDSHHQLHIMLD